MALDADTTGAGHPGQGGHFRHTDPLTSVKELTQRLLFMKKVSLQCLVFRMQITFTVSK